MMCRTVPPPAALAAETSATVTMIVALIRATTTAARAGSADLGRSTGRTRRDGPGARGRSYSRRMAASRQERAWVRGARAGSAADVEALFKHHWPLAYRAAYLVVHDAAAAEDIAQEAFLAALRALDRFDRRRPFGPWLHRIVVNRAIDWARARALRAEVSDDGTLERAAARTRAEQSDAEALAGGLAALSPEHRAVIV